MKRYSGDIYNDCKRLFVEEGNSPREISQSLGGKPTFQTVSRWAAKKDKAGKSWHDYREERIQQQYDALSPKSQIIKIYEKIDAILSAETFDVKSADQLSKLGRYMRDIIDPQYQIHIMYELLTDLVDYVRNHEPGLLTPQFTDMIRDFKNQLRSRLKV